MDRTDYQRLKKIFYSVSEMEPSSRDAFLDAECAGDSKIRREIEKLLSSYDIDFLEAPAATENADLMESGLEAGQVVSHYEIREKIGAGGMGEVYLAHDVVLDRPVALKLLPGVFTSDPAWVRRFQREVRSASALNHPNILTIHEIGVFEDTHFIATEYIEGVTLRTKLGDGALALGEALDIAIQAANAIDAVHHAGIVHRDIKPENIMIRANGLVKVLDFGLAKVESSKRPDNVTTTPGIVFGTVAYMSPEQVRGLKVDSKTDIWSLGVVLFEMLTGGQPFRGDNKTDIVADILNDRPQDPEILGPQFPTKLSKIVSGALEKDREKRYGTAAELLKDLEDFRTEFISGAVRPPPAGEDITQRVRNRKRAAAIAGMLLLVVSAAAITFFGYFRRSTPPLLTDKDVIFIADFDNQTGEEVFDGALKQALSIHLQQSPFLSLFADGLARDTLKSMNRSPDERITRDIGREICERRGVKAIIVGTIVPLGSTYALTLEAINARTNEVIASEAVEAAGREQVLAALSQAADRIRGKLGESLASIERFDVPINVTTSSLDALRVAFLAGREIAQGNEKGAISLFKNALEIDPNFASTYAGLAAAHWNRGEEELAVEAASKAFALRGGMNEWERLITTDFYYSTVTKELDRSIEQLEMMKRLFPRDGIARANLAARYNWTGEYDKAIEEANESLSRDPNVVHPYRTLTAAWLSLGRLEEAKVTAEQAIQLNFNPAIFRLRLFQVAFVDRDGQTIQAQLNDSKGKPDEFRFVGLQANMATYGGERKKGKEFAVRASKLAPQKGEDQWMVLLLTGQSLTSAAFGHCDEVGDTNARALAVERRRVALVNSAIAFAHCGDSRRTQSLVSELKEKYPTSTLVNERSLPSIKAALELKRGNAEAAIELLKPVRRGLESTSEFWIQYIRGSAYLKLNRGSDAAAEFQKILDHRGEAVFSPLYPIAYLGVARAMIQTGDTQKSREAYQKFFEIWKDADADLQLLVEAKREYAKLQAMHQWQ